MMAASTGKPKSLAPQRRPMHSLSKETTAIAMAEKAFSVSAMNGDSPAGFQQRLNLIHTLQPILPPPYYLIRGFHSLRIVEEQRTMRIVLHVPISDKVSADDLARLIVLQESLPDKCFNTLTKLPDPPTRYSSISYGGKAWATLVAELAKGPEGMYPVGMLTRTYTAMERRLDSAGPAFCDPSSEEQLDRKRVGDAFKRPLMDQF